MTRPQLPAKWVFVRALRNSRHLAHQTRTHYVAWYGCVAGCLLFSYVIASAVPIFNGCEYFPPLLLVVRLSA